MLGCERALDERLAHDLDVVLREAPGDQHREPLNPRRVQVETLDVEPPRSVMAGLEAEVSLVRRQEGEDFLGGGRVPRHDGCGTACASGFGCCLRTRR